MRLAGVHAAPRCRGFTLFELIATLLVAAILVSAAMPPFTSLLQSYRTKALTTTLQDALQTARIVAVERNVTVRVKPVSAGWSSGWSVYADLDADGAYDAAKDLLIQQVPSTDFPRSVSLLASSNASVVFRPNGEISGTPPVFQVCPARKGTLGARRITLVTTGHLRVVPTERCT